MDFKSTSIETVEKHYEKAKKRVRSPYLGNVPGHPFENTIARDLIIGK